MAIDIKDKKQAVSSQPATAVASGTMMMPSGEIVDLGRTEQPIGPTSNIATKVAEITNAMAPANTSGYAINYNDERFKQVERDKQAAIDKSNQTYDSMIGQSDSFYQGLIDETERYGEEQAKLQQEKTDFAIAQIEQQKAQEKEDYIEEQQGAYVDWQKQSDQYGAGAEQMAASGLMGTGFSESSQVQMYTAYQNRAAVARQTFNRAMTEYNNAITEARLANNSTLAQIAHDALMQKAEYLLAGFQNKNELLLSKIDKEHQLDSEYYNRWQDVLAQQNQENAMAEEIRQFNENMAFEREKEDTKNQQWASEFDFAQQQEATKNQQWADEFRFALDQEATKNEQWQKEFDFAQHQDATKNEQWALEFAESQRQHDENLAFDKQQLKVQQEQWQKEYDQGVKEWEESIRQFDTEIARLKAQDKKENELKIKQLEQQKKEAKQAQARWEAEMKEEKRQFDKTLAENKRQYNKSLSEEKRQFNVTSKKASGSSGSSSSSGSSKNSATNKSSSGNSSAKINKSTTTTKSSSGTTKSSTPTTAQKKSYSTFQTNIGNLMIKNPSESAIANMENQLKTAAKNGKITEAQYVALLKLLQ